MKSILSRALLGTFVLFNALNGAPDYDRILDKLNRALIAEEPTQSQPPPVLLQSESPTPPRPAPKEYSPVDFSNLYGMQGFSKALLDQHFKLYRGYVNNVNLLQNQLHTLVEQKKERSTEFADLKRHFGWEFDGMRLHELYFENLGGNGQLPTSGALKTAIEEQFGSLEAWKEAFIATGMMRGIGWVILYADVERGRLFNAWIDEHAEGHLATAKPLIVMDVWEHAYITEYGLNREGYIEAFFKNLDWNSVEKRFH